MIELSFDTNGVDWTEAARVFELAPLGRREPDMLRRAYEASGIVCFARDGETLVGLGRAHTDGVYQAVVYDLCLLPEYQGRGLGRRILQAILDRLDVESVFIWSVPGKEGFYSKFGFNELVTGMMLSRRHTPEQMREMGYFR